MPPYKLINFEYAVLMLGLGLIFSICIVLARGSRFFAFKRKKQKIGVPEDEIHEFGGEVTEGNSPVPVFIWLVFIGYFIWAVGYVIYRSSMGN